MATLTSNASLMQLQRFVAEFEIERGFANESVVEKCLLLGEEMGELFKAVRRHAGIGVDPNSSAHSTEDELADVLILLLSIANRSGIDMDCALRNKERKNARRQWQSDGD